MEALQRYEEERLPRPLRLWVEATLDLDPEASKANLLPDLRHQD